MSKRDVRDASKVKAVDRRQGPAEPGAWMIHATEARNEGQMRWSHKQLARQTSFSKARGCKLWQGKLATMAAAGTVDELSEPLSRVVLGGSREAHAACTRHDNLAPARSIGGRGSKRSRTRVSVADEAAPSQAVAGFES
ncbi:hypothetical protein CDD81_7368 [Ophiocordyceps australis]|uniref:Uncharacterized protein n=1 Tax=Ophiocordyceps australis TaxID=1399860 RepID=A0A2C5Y5D3_9HYPO|nr:hypothetical protein CDD81_7368 [Ophiocordyceps australis]